MKVKMLTSIAGHYFSYSPGEVVELDTQKAKKWIEAGIASPQKATRPPGEVAVKPSPKHVGGGYFGCKECGRSFDTRQGLAAHSRVHK